MVVRGIRLVGIALMGAALLVGCGENEGGLAIETAPQDTVDPFGPPTIPEGEVDWGRKHQEIYETVTVPNDEAESANWIREYVSIYENAYETCGGLVDVDSPRFDPAPEAGYTAVLTVTENARQTSERAVWVAWQGCRDGTSDYPFPIPEVEHLQRHP